MSDYQAFENGVLVPIVDGYAAIDAEEFPEVERVQQETVCRLLDMLIDGAATPEVIGKRVLFSAYDLRRPGVQTRAELAKKLGATMAAVSRSISRKRQQKRSKQQNRVP